MLKKCFASFFIALLIFSASVPLCFADDTVSASDFELGIKFGVMTGEPDITSRIVSIPSAQEYQIVLFSNSTGSDYTNFFINAQSNFYKPVSYERTVYVSIGFQALEGSFTPYYGGSTNPPDLQYSVDGSYTYQTLVDGVVVPGHVSDVISNNGELAVLKITIPANSNAFKFTTENAVWWRLPQNTPVSLFSLGGYIIDSGDSAVLDTVDSILSQLQSIDGNITTMVTAINEILAQMRLLNADTDTIVEMLGTLTSLSQSQLQRLEYISSSVDAIYHFLTQAMSSESQALTEQSANIATQIQTNNGAEEEYQLVMQGSFDDLNLDDFTFGGVNGALEVVGAIFTDMWSVFGEYKILFVYPLILGISCLIIGRLPKSGGGNSSRNAEHKGGEGGA